MNRRGPHKDPVTSTLRQIVLERDGFHCVAPKLDPKAGPCRNTYGHEITTINGRQQAPYLTLDHVKDAPMMGKRAPSDAAHLVTVCVGHHLYGWATANRPLLREYLRRFRDVSDADL